MRPTSLAILIGMGVLAAIAVALSIYRLVVGLGPTTNMSDHYPWGIWISIDLFLIPVAGAAFTISLISYYFGRERYHALIRPAVLAGFLGYSVVGVLLFLDIGRWTQFYNILIPQYINLHSFLEEISICVTLYTLILVIEIAPIFLERWGFKRPIQWINRSIYVVAGAGIILSTLHQSSLGSLFLLMPYKLQALWYTPALPVLFWLQATFTGLATTVVAITLTRRWLNLPLDRQLFHRLGQAMGLSLAMYLMVKIGDWLGSDEMDQLLRPNVFGWLAWIEIIVGVIIPMTILFSKLVGHSRGPFWAGIFVLIGTLINRLIVTWFGLLEPTPIFYIPSWQEIMITIGLACGGLLVFIITARYFDLFPRQEAHT
jgi:Ni/Fe-hydrogenase subunit HybB-like protein